MQMTARKTKQQKLKTEKETPTENLNTENLYFASDKPFFTTKYEKCHYLFLIKKIHMSLIFVCNEC